MDHVRIEVHAHNLNSQQQKWCSLASFRHQLVSRVGCANPIHLNLSRSRLFILQLSVAAMQPTRIPPAPVTAPAPNSHHRDIKSFTMDHK
jgi:hypothetical protein